MYVLKSFYTKKKSTPSWKDCVPFQIRFVVCWSCTSECLKNVYRLQQ